VRIVEEDLMEKEKLKKIKVLYIEVSGCIHIRRIV